MTHPTEIEKLHDAKHRAYEEWAKLRGPADAAYENYQAAAKAYTEAVLYEKIRRKVMRDLIETSNAGLPVDSP